MKEKYCPGCNGLKSASENFCSQCGVELIELPRCKYCHGVMLPLHRFCGMCGKPRADRVEEIEQPAKEEAVISSSTSDEKNIEKGGESAKSH